MNQALLRNIKLLLMDCDGVLTDGTIVYAAESTEVKGFSALDGLGLSLIPYTDMKVGVITGRQSSSLERRCSDLKVTYLFQKVRNKKFVASQLLEPLGITWEQVAYIGDDWNDYPLLQAVGLPVCPPNAAREVQQAAAYITSVPGGSGAVREVIELILKAKGTFETVIGQFIHDLQK